MDDITDLQFERDIEVLMGDRKRPKLWNEMSIEAKMDYYATRLLAEDREGTTSHAEIKESGILSVSQYERRKRREVYSEYGSLDNIKPKQGTFSRVHTRDLRGYKLDIEYKEKNAEGQNRQEDESV